MLFLIMIGALIAGAVAGRTAYSMLGRLTDASSSRRGFYLHAFASWLTAFVVYSIGTETYRPLFTETWVREAILGGDLIPVLGFSAFLAYVTLRWYGPAREVRSTGHGLPRSASGQDHR